MEETLRTSYSRKVSKETIYIGKKLSPGELIEIEFTPPESIESVEIFYNEPSGLRNSVVVKL